MKAIKSSRRSRASAIIWIAALLIVWGLAGRAAAAEPIGSILEAKGDVEINPAGSMSWQAALPKSKIHQNDTIRTRAKSRVKILFKDDSLLTLGENTLLEITEHIYSPTKNTRQAVYKMLRGKARAAVGKKFGGESKFELHTPTAVAGVKGTDFGCQYKDDEAWTWCECCECEQGDFYLRSSDEGIKGEQDLVTGQGSYVHKGKQPGLPEIAGGDLCGGSLDWGQMDDLMIFTGDLGAVDPVEPPRVDPPGGHIPRSGQQNVIRGADQSAGITGTSITPPVSPPVTTPPPAGPGPENFPSEF